MKEDDGTFRFTGRNLELARGLLLEITAALDAAGIVYMLDAGTLLGVVRDGDLIPWDSDIDISVPAEGLPSLLEVLDAGRFRHRWISRRYFKHGFDCWKQGDYRAIKIRNRRLFYFRGKLTADLYIKYRWNDAYYWSAMGMICKADARFFNSHGEVEYMGRRLKVPAFHEEYLAKIYGDWRTPDRNYNPKKDDGTIIGALSGPEPGAGKTGRPAL
jgi:phosphorylcholine metabolism protein LicD